MQNPIPLDGYTFDLLDDGSELVGHVVDDIMK